MVVLGKECSGHDFLVGKCLQKGCRKTDRLSGKNRWLSDNSRIDQGCCYKVRPINHVGAKCDDCVRPGTAQALKGSQQEILSSRDS